MYEVFEYKSISTFSSVFWKHTAKQKVHGLRVVELESLQQMIPSERQQLAVLRLLQSLRERREANAESHHLTVLVVIHHYGDEVQVGK